MDKRRAKYLPRAAIVQNFAMMRTTALFFSRFFFHECFYDCFYRYMVSQYGKAVEGSVVYG